MNDKVTVDGVIDATFSSYYGDTIDVTETDEKADKAELWPSDFMPEDATELQRQVVFTAVMHPNECTDEIGRRIGKDGGYVRATLKRCCNEWYQNTFKPAGSDGESIGVLNQIAQSCNNCNAQIILHTPLDAMPKLRCKCSERRLIGIPDGWER
jgi:hypothetical protein